MQNRHASASPVQLEDLLQVPLQVVRLEDLIREKASSVSPPQSTNSNGNNGADGRLCRSVDSQVPKSSNSPRDTNTKSSSSTPCLFDCCIKPTSGNYGGERLARDVRFKTAALNLPDGSSVVVPVVDFDDEERHEKNVLGQSKHDSAVDNDNDSDRTTSASPPHLESLTPPPIPPQIAPVVLGTVTEEPTRYEDFLLTHGCKISHNSIIGENRIQRNGGSKGIPQKTVGDTLELTFYNDGRKESGREYRPHLKEQDIRYFENQQLQLSRVIRDPGPVQQHPGNVENRSHFNNTHPARQKPHGNNTISKIFAQPALELTSSIINNLNKNSIANRLITTNNSHDSNGKTWEQIGLKISRCQKDEQRGVISVEDGEKVPEKNMPRDGDPRENGEAEILIERHLQAYLTSLKYVKPGSEEHPNKVLDAPLHRGRSITHGLSGLAPQPSRVHSPCEPAQITRIPNVRPPGSSPATGQQQHHLEAWPERTIARIPTRPYLRRNIPEEQPQPQMYPPPKRFRGNNVTQPNRQITAIPRQQELSNQQQIISQHQHPQYIAPNNVISNGEVDTNPAMRNQQQMHTNQRQHTVAYHASTTVPSPQHSPIVQQQYHPHPVQQHQQQQQQKYPNNVNQQQQQQLLVAAVAGSGGEVGLENHSYYERLRRYWEFYQRQELDWAKLTEYYQKYHFYPWDILSARDETIRQWRHQQQQYAAHPHLHAQLTQNGLQGDGRPIDFDNLTQQQQHQLALRAMNIAAANYANSKYSSDIASGPVTIQNRIAGMDVSPPSTSPLPPQVQNKYNHNSQQLQQLQQFHQRHLNLSLQQQQQHNQQQQRLRYKQEQQHQQQQQHQLQQQKAQQVVLMANQKLQNSVNYYSAYNQLAAAAAAIASNVASSPQNNSRSSSAMEKNCPPIVIIDEEKESEPEYIPIPVNTHRQTLELAMKNNFRNRSNSAGNATMNSAFVNQYRARKDISTPPQSQPASTTVTAHHPQQRSWPKNGNGSGNGAINMTKESQKTSVSSPNSSVQPPTSVIRRLRIIQPKPPPSYSSSSSSYTAQQRNSNETHASMQNSVDNNDTMTPIPLVLHKNRHYARECANNGDGNRDNRGEVESNVAANRNSADDSNRKTHNQQHSPIPMVAGEEEVITSVSPSAVLSNYDDMPGEDDGGGDDKDAYNSRDTPEPWKYDHVVLLDKRIKTYMCKRCFETLKTEQQIRNHLFCKMLANHVQCHVCLQLFTSDAYPAHLQIHGVRPLEDTGSDE